MMRALLLAAALSLTAPAPGAAPIVLDATTTIVVGPEQPGPVMEAARDLAADFEQVVGRKPRIVERRENAAAPAIVIATAGNGAAESFSITAADGAVRLSGADMRGTIYAVYQFSEDYLGVDPLYYWTDHVPPRKPRIDIADGLRRDFAAPVFTYRGFFVNDEALLTGWAPAPAGEHTGIALATWNKIYETTLRLKGNTVAPGTWIFSDE